MTSSLPSRRAVLAGGAAGVAGLLVGRGAAYAAVDPSLRPFQWGVASGDPRPDGITLWTRIDPTLGARVPVTWVLSRDPDQRQVVRRGAAVATAARDHTVKVHVDGLPVGTTLFYAFVAGGRRSMVGRTRTTPAAGVERVRLALASCAKYDDGFYNAYRLIAESDVDAVLHLGDYIYETPRGEAGERAHEPAGETFSLADYRERYRLYRTDPDLQRLHQQHPVVAVWDDHESADNAWRGGAGNHTEDSEGPWAPRKQAAQQAYDEWLPIRLPVPDDPTRIWRSVTFGDLAEVVMLDTRLERDAQVSNAAAGSTADNDDPERVMLSDAQRTFLYDRLLRSRSQWKVIGQQVLMAHWRVVGLPEQTAPVTAALGLTAKSGVFYNSDGWDGYTVERDRLFAHLSDNGIEDVVTVTGDIHSAWANELVPGADPLAEPVAVEFVTPGISTGPFAGLVGGSPSSSAFEAQFMAANPWVRAVDMDPNGFTLLDITPERTQADWTYTTVDSRPGTASDGPSWHVDAGTTRLQPSAARTAPRSALPPDAPAPKVVDVQGHAPRAAGPAAAPTAEVALPATGSPSWLPVGAAAALVALLARRSRGAAPLQ